MAEPEETPSVEPVEGNDEVKTDYESMSVEDIDAEFERTGGVNVQEEPVEPEPEQAPLAAEAESTEKTEPQEATDKEATTEPTDVPAEPEPDDRELQLQEMQLQVERMRLDKQHFEHLAGKNATAVDDLRRELQSSMRASPAVEDPINLEDNQPSVAPSPRIVPDRNEALAGKVAELQRAHSDRETERVYADFSSVVDSDLAAQGVAKEEIVVEREKIFNEQIAPTLKQRFEPYGNLSEYPINTLSKVTRMVLDAAYVDVKLAKVAVLRKTVSERNAVQIAENKIAKQAASTSGSGGRPVQESQPKSISDLSAEEADAELTRLSGEGIYRPRR